MKEPKFIYELTKENMEKVRENFIASYGSSFTDPEMCESACRWIETLVLEINLMWESGLQKAIKEIKRKGGDDGR
jgi:hypothetical protein